MKRDHTSRVLVTGAAHPSGRNCVRALVVNPSVEVLAGDSRDQALSDLPYDVPKLRLPRSNAPDFSETVGRICVQNDIGVILPCLDEDALVLARDRQQLSQAGVAIPLPDVSVLSRAIDKSLLVEAARFAGLPVAKTVVIHGEDEIRRLGTVSYPIVIKPAVGFGARGVLIYDSPPRTMREVSKLLKRGKVLAQEYVPGGRGSIYLCALLFDRQHAIKCSFQSVSTRTQFDFGGPALAGVSIRDARLKEYCEKLIRQLGPWVGVINVEFKKHSETGDLYVLDANPRIWGYSSLAEDAGISFPFGALLVAEAVEFRSQATYLMGVTMERNGLQDTSSFEFSCGKRVKIERIHGTRSTRRIAIVTEETSFETVMKLSVDPTVTAVIQIHSKESSRSRATPAPSEIYQWLLPQDITLADAYYLLAHLFGAGEVRIFSGETVTVLPWCDISSLRWRSNQPEKSVK